MAGAYMQQVRGTRDALSNRTSLLVETDRFKMSRVFKIVSGVAKNAEAEKALAGAIPERVNRVNERRSQASNAALICSLLSRELLQGRGIVFRSTGLEGHRDHDTPPEWFNGHVVRCGP